MRNSFSVGQVQSEGSEIGGITGRDGDLRRVYSFSKLQGHRSGGISGRVDEGFGVEEAFFVGHSRVVGANRGSTVRDNYWDDEVGGSSSWNSGSCDEHNIGLDTDEMTGEAASSNMEATPENEDDSCSDSDNVGNTWDFSKDGAWEVTDNYPILKELDKQRQLEIREDFIAELE